MRRLILPLALLAAMATATTAIAAPPPTAGAASDAVTLEVLGRYETGVFDDGAAEIVGYDAGTQAVFVVNAAAGELQVLDVSDPTDPMSLGTVGSNVPGGSANSVAVSHGLVAVVVAADPATDPGVLELFEADAVVAALLDGEEPEPLAVLDVGANPDMVTFTPNGRTILVANEGEPNDDYTIDPEGSISVIDLGGNPDRLDQDAVRTAGFTAFNGAAPDGVRVFGPDATVAQDLEPEYIAVSRDGRTAWVSLQENNALAVVDVASAVATDLLPLGTKDHSLAGNAIDASNRDEQINITNWPVHGLYQPDAIASYRVRGTDYVVTANEGDARDYDGFSEEARVKDLGDPDEGLDGLCVGGAFGDTDAIEELQQDENLGRLNITTTLGHDGDAACYTDLYAYGTRSFSIWTGGGELVFDSGDQFERITAAYLPDEFNSTNDENGSFDNRSDDKGPEPEAVALGTIQGRTFAFIGLERIGGIVIYDVSDPSAPEFVDYVTTRDFTGDAEAGTAGDLGPEGIVFVDAHDSPTGRPMLVIGHEVSGTTVLFDVVALAD